jgi:Na+-transporting methylmalonyl-CoA/oxaloacetate decarboxylase gamma subunit
MRVVNLKTAIKGKLMIENSFANVMRICGTGFGLVVVVMILLAAIMEVMGIIVQKWEKRRSRRLAGDKS